MRSRGALVLVLLLAVGTVLPGTLVPPASVTGMGFVVAPVDVDAASPPPKQRQNRANRPARGRFKAAAEGARCSGPGTRLLRKSGRCTHGPDPAPPGVDVDRRVPTGSSGDFRAQASFTCEGDGHTGFRIQVLYVHPVNEPSRFAETYPRILGWLDETNDIYEQNALDTGGLRTLRFVTDGNCLPVVVPVAVSDPASHDFDAMIVELQVRGYSRPDRIYLSYVDQDKTGICGIATISPDERPARSANWNNVGPAYSRIDPGCWGARTTAHEIMHNLGGVQRNAPNASGFGHCIDEYDIMCYKDGPGVEMIDPPPCGVPTGNDLLLDCGHGDYYHANPPPGSYLSRFWNPTNNQFLVFGLPDTAPPRVSVAAPRAKLVRPGRRIKISAGAADNTGISAVIFRVCPGASCTWARGKQIGVDASAPYQATWKVPKRGTFTFVARAIDSVGNATVSAPKRIRIKPAKKARHKRKRAHQEPNRPAQRARPAKHRPDPR